MQYTPSPIYPRHNQDELEAEGIVFILLLTPYTYSMSPASSNNGVILSNLWILNFTFSDFGINGGIHVALNNCACVLAYNL